MIANCHAPEPPPPGSAWVDVLRWLVVVMDGDDEYLAFVASCLSWALRHDGALTTRQHAACQGIFNRVLFAFDQGILACQLAHDHPLRDVEPEGSA